MPAAEPGHEQRSRRQPVHREEAHLPEADRDLVQRAARPRAVRAVPALHPFLRADRRRPVHRPARARRRAADRDERRAAVPVLLLRQHGADLPGRCAHRRVVPVSRAPVRPAVDRLDVRALLVRLLAARRLAPFEGDPPALRRRSRGQRGMELRQGALGLPLRRAGRPAHRPPRARQERPAGRIVLAGRARGGSGRPARQERRRAAGRPADRRGRLRLREVRAARAEHERHRLPVASAQRGGDRVPRRARRGRDAAARLVCGAGEGTGSAARRVRAGGGVADRLPAAAQGRPQAWDEGRRGGAAALARRREAGRAAGAHPARRRSRSAVLVGDDGDHRPRAGRRGDPRRRAAGHRARCARRRPVARGDHRCGAGLGAPPGR